MESGNDRVTSEDMENISKRLFKLCMKGEWEKVIETYENDKEAHKALITRTGDTALHVAVTDGQDDVVQQLVHLICSVEDQQALQIQNERKNTVLHFAASMGSVQTSVCIASVDKSLLSVRNVDGETPLFLAALHGRKEAFLSLHYLCNPDPMAPNYYSFCRRNDGDTILHAAIARDYFDLAFQIIHLYKDLVNSVNQDGFTPLHLLANKPSVFRSGGRLGRFEAIVYYSMIVKELKVAPNSQQSSPKTDKEKISYPKNYETCMELLRVAKKFTDVVTKPFTQFLHKPQKDPDGTQRDVEAPKKPFTQFLHKPQKDPDGTQRDVEAPKKIPTNNGAERKSSETSNWSHPLFPPNYKSSMDLFKFVFMVMSVIFGIGSSNISRIRRKKEKHVWSAQILDELLKRASMYEYDETGATPPHNSEDKDRDAPPYAVDDKGRVTLRAITEETTKGDDKQQKKEDEKNEKEMLETLKKIAAARNNVKEMVEKMMELFQDMDAKKKNGKMLETPILIAARNGVTEMVEKIIDLFPVAVHDMDSKKKNIVLLAVENRQTYLYNFLLKKQNLKESIFSKVDEDGNSALHLAAKLGDYKPWLIPGEALQMHWEIKWYLFVKESIQQPHFFSRYNKENKTARDIFSETHKDLVIRGGEWLKKTSESCSLVAALIATVAFSTSTTVPGDFKNDTGTPTLEDEPEFRAFAISSLIALCCSVTSLVLFLSILTSRYQERDFGRNLPRKLILGLTSLFMSITSMMVCFCTGHFFELKDKLRSVAVPVYAVTCLPVTLFALAQFPLYIDLIWATFKKVPQRGYKTSLH